MVGIRDYEQTEKKGKEEKNETKKERVKIRDRERGCNKCTLMGLTR